LSNHFRDDVDIPKMLMMDGTGKFTDRHTDFVKHVWRMWIKLYTLGQEEKIKIIQ
jgi:hypothetical protein